MSVMYILYINYIYIKTYNFLSDGYKLYNIKSFKMCLYFIYMGINIKVL